MKVDMEKYSISILANIAGVTVRTLQYYDKIGLLKPFERKKSGYRYYRKEELYKLQQIMFFKELDFPLKKIKNILENPDFDLVSALSRQRKELEKRATRLTVLLNTIDKTLIQLNEDNEMVTEKELYEGFSKEEVHAWKEEVELKYSSELVNESRENVKNMTKADFRKVKTEQEQIAKDLSLLMDKPIESDEVQAVIKRHHTNNERFYKTDATVYKGLADMYVSDPRFAEFYNKYRQGLANFIRKSMHCFADNSLTKK